MQNEPSSAGHADALFDDALFRHGFENAPLPAVVLRGANIALANAAFVRAFGYSSHDELVGLPAVECLVESERVNLWERFAERYAAGRSEDSFETMGLRQDGAEFPFRFDITTFEWPSGPVEIGYVTDLSDVRQTEDALRASEARYRTLFEASPVSLWEEDFSEAKREIDTLRESGIEDFDAYLMSHPEETLRLAAGLKVIDVNTMTAMLQGARDKDELLSSLEQLVSAESAALFQAELLAIARGETSFRLESPARTLQGVVRDFIVCWAVAPGWEDTFGRVFVSIIDVTDTRRVERELREYRDHLEELVQKRTQELSQTNQELMRATRAKDEFLANMSHEFRTPLNSILGFTGIMLQGLAGPLTEEQQRQLGMVRSSGNTLLALVSDILDLAKIEAKASELRITSFSVRPLVKSLVDRMHPLAAEKGLKVLLVDDRAPETMTTDEDKLSQILLNLLSNAIKFTMSGTVSLEVAELGDSRVRFIVSDTGIGIPEDRYEAVFEPFLQLESMVSAKTAGTGLGLTIARDLSLLLRGELEMASEVGSGSTFSLTLPLG